MNILFISCRNGLFDNLMSGSGIRSTLFVKALSKVGHVDVVYLGKETVTSNIPNCTVIYNSYVPVDEVKLPVWYRKIYNLKFLLLPWETSSYFKLNKEAQELIEGFLKKKDYVIIACRYLNDAIPCGLDKHKERLVIDVDDHPVSALLLGYYLFRFRNIISKYICYSKCQAIGFMSRRLLNKVSVSFYSNILEPTSKKSIYLPNVTINQQQVEDVTDSTPSRLLFVGLLSFEPNRFGILHFVEHVFPKIKSVIPEVELHIAGRTTDESLLNLLNSHDGVRTLGFVDDIYEAYRNCRVVVIPMYQGAGTSVKFVEGLRMNRPMVSTPMGARGFESLCRDGEEFMLAKDDNEFASKIIMLLKNPLLAKTIAHNAYKVGKENFSVECFENIVVKAIKDKFPKG